MLDERGHLRTEEIRAAGGRRYTVDYSVCQVEYRSWNSGIGTVHVHYVEMHGLIASSPDSATPE